ncbi:MAG: hypothetical protein J6562_08500 [Candidatus Schmidhempelia sp.]|uniref:hypothetical protein n=1 Tax=Snodgrassella sp. TaxID=2815304 RepID=UPI00258672F7|nr:hypothetical protein [Snodgrassella sp.]MCO6514798.1 hypothetical protein [Snodgrassella sp.]MCO6519369.1 hypothetical protein [Snodgrassella sp.]MCO6525046.1 hypothetical protein [Candidatus Schmidhempelia sp.]MCO6527169.1 hypothetical protein [Snodgrassella sp.]
MIRLAIFWSRYKSFIFILVMILWFSLFGYAKWGIRNGKFGYELDNDEKEAIMMKQLPDLIWPYKLNNKNIINTKRGPTSKIYVIFEFKRNDDEGIKKLYSIIDKNSKKLGFNQGCRGKESIFVYYSNNFNPDPTVTELPPKQYTIEWEYPNPMCVRQIKKTSKTF